MFNKKAEKRKVIKKENSVKRSSMIPLDFRSKNDHFLKKDINDNSYTGNVASMMTDTSSMHRNVDKNKYKNNYSLKNMEPCMKNYRLSTVKQEKGNIKL